MTLGHGHNHAFVGIGEDRLGKVVAAQEREVVWPTSPETHAGCSSAGTCLAARAATFPPARPGFDGSRPAGRRWSRSLAETDLFDRARLSVGGGEI
jgi:hypothetical protein